MISFSSVFTAMSDEKLCLKWNNFQEAVSESFGELRDDKDFTDVTLACEDQTIKAHRVILASSSPFFKKLFKTHPHAQPLIYMRGLKFNDLVAILDFIYGGEAKVFQEDLQTFLSLAEELELRGLSRDQNLMEGKEAAEQKYQMEYFAQNDQSRSRTNFGAKKIIHEDTNVSYDEAKANVFQRALVPTHLNAKIPSSLIDSDTLRMINSLFEKQFDRLACIKCDYTSRDSSNIKKHVEKHIEGLSYPCTFCGKVSRSSQSFRNHKFKNEKNLTFIFSFSVPATVFVYTRQHVDIN